MKIFLLLFFALFLNATTLDELIDLAIKQNKNIQSANIDTQIKDAQKSSVKRSNYGKFEIVSSYTKYNTARTLIPLSPIAIQTNQATTTTKDILSVGINYSSVLFSGFAKTSDIEIASLAQNISKIKQHLTKEEIIFNIKSIYTQILSLKEQEKAQVDYTQALNNLKSIIEQEIQYGKKARIDLIKVEVEVQNSKTKDEILKTNILNLKSILSYLVGSQVNDLAPLNIIVEKESFIQDIQDLDKIKILESNLIKLKKQIQKANSINYPIVLLNAYYGQNSGEDEVTGDYGDEEVWRAGINIKYNLFDFGSSSKKISSLKLEYQKAQLAKNDAIDSLKKDLQKAINELNLAIIEYQNNQTQLQLANESADIEEARYKSNSSTLNDLLLAKAKAKLALAKLIDSKYKYQKSKYYIEYLLEKGIK